MSVVGESHYQEQLRELKQSDRERFTAHLIPEPDNPHDPNAVQVCGPAGETLGYLRRRVAKQYARCLAEHPHATCPAKLTGGTREKRTIGLVLEWTTVRALWETWKAGQHR